MGTGTPRRKDTGIRVSIAQSHQIERHGPAAAGYHEVHTRTDITAKEAAKVRE